MRVLIYSHDTYGLGHLRRSLAIAEALITARADASVLVVTGSPKAQSFELPPRCDTMKLPTILKEEDGSYRSRDLDISLDEIVALRSRLIVSAFLDFRPDVVLVDHAPLGVAGELLPLLDLIREDRRGAALVLGMRDIVDEAAPLARSWRRNGVMEALETVYDRILVYGSDAILTTATELGLDGITDRNGERKLVHVGVLTRPVKRQAASGRLLVTAGGGGDGHRLLRSFLDFVAAGGRFTGGIDLVTGPFLSHRRRQEIASRVAALPIDADIELIDFDPELEERIARSAGVVAMAGYNTVAEILASKRPALLVPREKPRREQLIRAQRLAEVTGLRYRRQKELRHDDFASFIAALEKGERPANRRLGLDGLVNTVRILGRLADDRRGPRLRCAEAGLAEDADEGFARRSALRLAGSRR